MTPLRSPMRLTMALGLGLPAIAVLQAWAASALVGSALSPENAAALRAPDVSPASPSRAPAAVVPEQNSSKAVTSLAVSSPEPGTTPTPRVRVDPLRVPRCEGVRVVATSQSPDPRDSIAIVQGPHEPRGFVRRVGNDVAGRRVAFIGRNPLEWSPAVWLSGEDGLCQAVLRDRIPEVEKASPAAASRATASAATRAPRALSPSIAAGIANVGGGTFRVERSALQSILDQAMELLRSVKGRPAKVGKSVVGFELRRVPKGTLLDVLGLKNGDILQSVNGFELTGPAQALQAYARLRTANTVRVKALRNGVPLELEYRIQ